MIRERQLAAPTTGRRARARLKLCGEELAMEVHPGVFVSNISTEEWQADPEVGGGAEEHVLVDTGAMRAGLSRFASDADPEPPPWVLPQTEILLVLEGAARIEIEEGPTLDLGPGDMASLPKGAVTRWRLTLPFKEMWVLV
jgi:quercetin dioxygenase-like cupin family protein